MYGTSNKIISRFELQSLADQGKILLKPGVNIKDVGDDKLLTREEIWGYAYCQASTILSEPTGFNGGFNIGSYETFNWVTGLATVGQTPIQGKRGTDYDLLISPTVSYYYGKTANLYCNEIGSPYMDVDVLIEVNKFNGTSEGSYAKYSNGEVYDLSSILRSGNYVDFTVTAGATGWTANGLLFLEVKENGNSTYKTSKYLTTGSSSTNLTFRTQINYGVSYEFRGYVRALTQYNLNFSNATGYRACHL
jgi:hypothetical protein